MMCYIELNMVSSTEEPIHDTCTLRCPKESRYSLVSVAAAMYLMTCIASADLAASIALLSEAVTGMTTRRCVQRKMFGFMLLLSFLLLGTGSFRVLFATAFDDVHLVIGATAILFIADVDEKVMVVLKAIPSEWRLFWVLEVIGLSVGFALLGLRTTGHGDDIIKDNIGCIYDGNNPQTVEDCYIYSWYFILQYHPLSVTLASLLVNTIVVSPKAFMEKHGLGNCSPQYWIFALFLALWILAAWSFYFNAAFRGAMLDLYVIILSAAYIICLTLWSLFMAFKRSVCCRRSVESNPGSMNFQLTLSMRFGLIYAPVSLFLIGMAVEALAINFILESSGDGDDGILNPSMDWFYVPETFYHVLFEIWLIWCMCREGTDRSEMSSSQETVNAVAESHDDGGGSHRLTKNLVLGSILTYALFFLEHCLWDQVLLYVESTGDSWAFLLLSATFMFSWTLVGVCAAASNTKGVAFWSLATYMLTIVVFTLWVWADASDNIRFDYF